MSSGVFRFLWKWRRRLLVALSLAGIAAISFPCLQDLWLWRSAETKEWSCLNGEAIALAPCFTDDGLLTNENPAPVNRSIVIPGRANRTLAQWLKDHARCFSAIYTQRGISDVWLEAGDLFFATSRRPSESDYALLRGTRTRVYQMHAHVSGLAPVRTLEALRAALERVRDSTNQKVVLVAHDAHFWRAYFDLSSLVDPARIINPGIRDVPFPASQGLISWYLREAAVRPIEFCQRHFRSKVRPAVALEPVIPE